MQKYNFFSTYFPLIHKKCVSLHFYYAVQFDRIPYFSADNPPTLLALAAAIALAKCLRCGRLLSLLWLVGLAFSPPYRLYLFVQLLFRTHHWKQGTCS